MFKKVLLFFSLLLIFGCNTTPSKPETQKNLILVSIAPYKFLTEQIAGSDFEIQTVVPGAANPHSYEPTAAEVNKMSRSSIWFRIGEPFEEKIAPILLSRNDQFVICDLRDGISLIKSDNEDCKQCSKDHLDRHVWMSPRLARSQAEIISKTLSQSYPQQRETFQKNLKVLQENLSQLDTEIGSILKQVKNRTILVSHPAFGYFCKDYNLTQLSVEHEGRDPRPQHLEKIVGQIGLYNVKLALTLPQHNNKGTQLIAKKLNLSTHLVDPYSPNYFETMKTIALLLADEN